MCQAPARRTHTELRSAKQHSLPHARPAARQHRPARPRGARRALPLGAGRACAAYICTRHFLKLRSSVQTCSSACRQLATCSMGTMRQWPGTRQPLRRRSRVCAGGMYVAQRTQPPGRTSHVRTLGAWTTLHKARHAGLVQCAGMQSCTTHDRGALERRPLRHPDSACTRVRQARGQRGAWGA